jgi:hypothetical protein
MPLVALYSSRHLSDREILRPWHSSPPFSWDSDGNQVHHDIESHIVQLVRAATDDCLHVGGEDVDFFACLETRTNPHEMLESLFIYDAALECNATLRQRAGFPWMSSTTCGLQRSPRADQ